MTPRNKPLTLEDYPSPVIDVNGCHIWQGDINNYGYPIRGGGKRHTVKLVHREVYELKIGPIPEGYTIDHVYSRGCRSKACINPDHLEAVTRSENTSRRFENFEQCKNGHPGSERKWSETQGRLVCPGCARERTRKHRAKKGKAE
jgi:hypothetical protein